VLTKSGKKFKLRLKKKQRLALVKALTKSTQVASVGNAGVSSAAKPNTDSEIQVDDETEDDTEEETEVAAATTTSTTPAAEKVETVAKKSPWSSGYLNILSANMKEFSEQKGGVFIYHQINVAYKWNGLKFAIKPSLIGSFDLEGGAVKNTMGDTILEATKGGLFKIGDIGVMGRFRYYFPSGESFRKSKTNGLFYWMLNAGKDLTKKINISYTLNPRYYIQSVRSVGQFDEDGRLLGQAKGNASWRIIQSLDLSETISDNLSFSQSIGTDFRYKYADPGFNLTEQKAGRSLDTSFGVSTTIFGKLSVTFLLEQSYDLDSEDGYKFLNSKETSYTLVSYLPF